MLASSSRLIALALVGLLLFVGCGQKGPLYLPDDAAHQSKQKQPEKPKQ